MEEFKELVTKNIKKTSTGSLVIGILAPIFLIGFTAFCYFVLQVIPIYLAVLAFLSPLITVSSFWQWFKTRNPATTDLYKAFFESPEELNYIYVSEDLAPGSTVEKPKVVNYTVHVVTSDMKDMTIGIAKYEELRRFLDLAKELFPKVNFRTF